MYQQPYLPEEVEIPAVEFMSPLDNPVSYLRGVGDSLKGRQFHTPTRDQLRDLSRNVKDAYQSLDSDLRSALFQEYADIVMDLAHLRGNLRARNRLSTRSTVIV